MNNCIYCKNELIKIDLEWATHFYGLTCCNEYCKRHGMSRNTIWYSYPEREVIGHEFVPVIDNEIYEIIIAYDYSNTTISKFTSTSKVSELMVSIPKALTPRRIDEESVQDLGRRLLKMKAFY